MVTSYYIMKMSAHKEVDIADYYRNAFDTRNTNNNTMTCRICLREGSIPIYSEQGTPGLVQALAAFAGVNISEEDDYPKHLCKVCYKFLRDAILFRKTAKLTDQLLRKPVKLEDVDSNSNLEPDDSNSVPQNFEEEMVETDDLEDKVQDNPLKWDNKFFAHIKPIVVDKKLPPKVNCKICKKLVSRTYYKSHLTMHDPNHEKKHVCEVCGKKFRLECSYYNHRNIHRTDFPLKCQFCPYRARYGHLLRTHLRTHCGDFKYMCNECPKRFLFKSNMNAHILKKHRTPQHKCQLCERSFHTTKDLQKHFEADHMGIKNHVCDYCGKAFGYRNAMMKHQRGVHKREKMISGRMPTYLQYENEQLNKQIEELQ